jgi:hypothetical protein
MGASAGSVKVYIDVVLQHHKNVLCNPIFTKHFKIVLYYVLKYLGGTKTLYRRKKWWRMNGDHNAPICLNKHKCRSFYLLLMMFDN